MPPEDGVLRPVNREPFMGPRIRSRRTGEVRYWVGDRYVSENDPARLTSQEQTARQEAIDQANRQQSALPDLHRFEELNRRVPTGALPHSLGQFLWDLPQIFRLDTDEGLQALNPLRGADRGELDTASGIEEMRAITNRMTPRQRVPGSGGTSDFEGRMFRGGIPNRGMPGPANSATIRALEREARDSQEYAEFIDWYWPRNGSLTGAQESFGRYRVARERNPRLTWRQFFNATPPRPQGVPESARWDGANQQWVDD